MVALKEKYAGIRKSLIKTKTESIRLNAEIELACTKISPSALKVTPLPKALRDALSKA